MAERTRGSIVPPLQLARDGYHFTFPGLTLRPLAVTKCFVRLFYKWDGDTVLPPEDDIVLISHQDFNNLIGNINQDQTNDKSDRRIKKTAEY